MYSSTRKFTSIMDREDIRYSYEGVRENTKSEVVSVTYSGDNMDSIRVMFFFSEDCEDVAIHVFDMARVPSAKVSNVMEEINRQNSEYRFVRFYLDTDDNTIQLAADACFRENDVDEICLELLHRIVSISDDVYPIFMKAIFA